MLRAQMIAKKVKATLQRGTPNVDAKAANIETYNLLEFMRDILQEVRDSKAVAQQYPNLKPDSSLAVLFQASLKALITEIYQCGNCGEHARLVAMEYLKSGINMSFTLVSIFGINDHGMNDGHTIPILNLDSKDDVMKPEDWKNFIVNDTWNPKCKGPVRYDRGHANFYKDFVGDFFVSLFPEKTTIKLKVENNLTKAEWREMAAFIKVAKTVITIDLITTLLKKRELHTLDAKKEVEKIHQKLDEEIALFEKLSSNLPVPPKSFNVADRAGDHGPNIGSSLIAKTSA